MNGWGRSFSPWLLHHCLTLVHHCPLPCLLMNFMPRVLISMYSVQQQLWICASYIKWPICQHSQGQVTVCFVTRKNPPTCSSVILILILIARCAICSTVCFNWGRDLADCPAMSFVFVCWQIKIQMQISWVGWSTTNHQASNNRLRPKLVQNISTCFANLPSWNMVPCRQKTDGNEGGGGKFW